MQNAVMGRGWLPMGESLRPYGDTRGDGMVQLSGTLPVPHGPRAEGAAAQLAQKKGLDPAMVAHSRSIGGDFTSRYDRGAPRAVLRPA